MKEITSKAVLNVGKRTAIIGFYNTALANEIVAQLPLDLLLENAMGRELFGESLPFEVKTQAEKQTYFTVGDFVYWQKGNALALFYAEGSSPDVPSGVTVIGRILSDLSVFDDLPQFIGAKLESEK